MTNLWLIFGLFILAYSIYPIWASIKISVRQDENFFRAERFQEKLELRPGEYECILTQDEEKWAKTSYTEVRDKIIESTRFVFDYLIPIHFLGVRFILKAIEKDKLIYAALGTDSCNWESPEARLRRRSFESQDS